MPSETVLTIFQWDKWWK